MVSAEKFGVHVCGGTHYQSRMSRSHLKSELAVCNVLVRPRLMLATAGLIQSTRPEAGKSAERNSTETTLQKRKLRNAQTLHAAVGDGLTFSDVAKGSCGSVKCRHWKR